MLRQSALFFALVVILLAGFVAGERAFSPSFQRCISQYSETSGQSTTAKESASGFSAVTAYVHCTGVFIDTNSGPIAALAALIIAAFTGTLWWATSQQANLTREALFADRRAYIFAVGLVPFHEKDTTTGQHNWRFRPALRNSGKTPPKRMRMTVGCEIRNTPFPQGYSFKPDPQNIVGGVIPPGIDVSGGQAPQVPGAPVTPQDIVESQKGNKYIYLWGWIKYYDIFPGTPEYTTHYCWLIVSTGDPFTYDPTATGRPPAVGTMDFNYIHHVEGNYIDEDYG